MAPSAGAATSLEVNFAAPAQATPSLQVTHPSWVLVLFANDTNLEGAMEWPTGAQGTNVTRENVRAMYLQDQGVERTVAELPGEQTFAPLAMSVQRGMGGWSSLYIEGDDVGLQADATSAQLRVSRAGECALGFLHSREVWPQPARAGSLCHGDDQAVVILRPAAGNASMPFSIEGKAVQVAEWHNLHTSCDAAPCPEEGVRRTDWTNVSSSGFAREIRAYERLASDHGGPLAFGGTASVILAGSGKLDLFVDGSLRLPSASDIESCPACVALDDRTLQVQGNIVLDDLHMEPNGTLTASLGGDIQAARIDESAIDAALLVGASVTAGAAVAVVGILLLVKLLIGFTRLEPDRVVDHPRRRAILDYIRDRPGAGFREVMRATKTSSSILRRHLELLKLTGKIIEERHGRSRRFLPKGVRDATPMEAILLREEPLARVYALVERNPWLSQGDIMDLAARELAYSRSTTQHRLGRLLRGGLLQVRRQGKFLLHAVKSS